MVIADFAPPSGGWFARWLSRVYYAPVAAAAFATGLAALHPIYDYETELRRQGFVITSRETFEVVRATPPLYYALTATRARQR